MLTIKKLWFVLLTTLILTYSSFAVGQSIEDKREVRSVAVDPVAYNTPSTDPKQLLDNYQLTIKQVIVDGEDLNKYTIGVDQFLVYQESMLNHVDSLIYDFQELYLQLYNEERKKEETNRKLEEFCSLALLSLALLWTILLGLSWGEGNTKTSTLLSYLVVVTYGIIIYKLPLVISALSNIF